MSNHEPENGAEKCDHYARGECDPPPSFILDWAMHPTGGMGESDVVSSILNQAASYLAHCEAKINNNSSRRLILKPRDAHLL